MAYNLRNRNPKLNYTEISDSESESNNLKNHNKRSSYGEISDSESESNYNGDERIKERVEGRMSENQGRRYPFSRKPRYGIGNVWETRSDVQSMIMETTPSSMNEIDTNVPETSNNPEQSLSMETTPSSMNEPIHVEQTNHNQEQSLMTETNPSTIAGTSSMNVTYINVPETINNLVQSSTLGTTPSSIPGPLPSTSVGTTSGQQRKEHSKKTILAWLTACKELDEGNKVHYHDGEKVVTGQICNGGILCNCCDEEISVWEFEMHAKSVHMQPYRHIWVVRGKSLLYLLQNLLISVWLREEEQKRRDMFTYAPKHDVACLVCGEGEGEGEFIKCRMCPSSYHYSCAHLKDVRRDIDKNWLCPYCRCKYCAGDENIGSLVMCSQCNKHFHWKCVKKSEEDLLKTHCSVSCKEIDKELKDLIGHQNNINGNESFSWRVLQQTDTKSEDHYVISNSKVAVACMLMNEAFQITDPHTGINVVQSVIYNCRSNLRRLDFRRCYTIVIEEDDAIIAAATIRFHGSEIAEMPFIATDEAYRGKRICHLLMGIIKSFFERFKVENWIISSNPATLEMWKNKFGFDVVCNKKLKKKQDSCNILMFPGAIKLHKYVILPNLNE